MRTAFSRRIVVESESKLLLRNKDCTRRDRVYTTAFPISRLRCADHTACRSLEPTNLINTRCWIASVFICSEPRENASLQQMVCYHLDALVFICFAKGRSIGHNTKGRNNMHIKLRNSSTTSQKELQRTLHSPPRPLLRRTTQPKHLAIIRRSIGLISPEHRPCRNIAKHDIPTAAFSWAHETWCTRCCAVD
jgi:hypothetical protein